MVHSCPVSHGMAWDVVHGSFSKENLVHANVCFSVYLPCAGPETFFSLFYVLK